VLGTERADRLLDTCWRVDELPDVSVLLGHTVPAEPLGRRHPESADG